VILRRGLLALSVLSTLLAQPASAAHPEGESAQVSVAGDGYLELNGRRYRGPFVITAHDDGVAVVERIGLDAYLEGNREVTLRWDSNAMEDHIVAASNYPA